MFAAKVLLWLAYSPVKWLCWLLKYPLAPIAVLFFSTSNRKRLRPLFYYLETFDYDLGGDEGWQQVHIKPGSDPYSNWNRIKWLWRNGFNRLNYQVLGQPMWGDYRDWLRQREHSQRLWIRADGVWQFRAKVYIPIWGRYWTPFCGWGLCGTHKQFCKYSATLLRFEKS